MSANLVFLATGGQTLKMALFYKKGTFRRKGGAHSIHPLDPGPGGGSILIDWCVKGQKAISQKYRQNIIFPASNDTIAVADVMKSLYFEHTAYVISPSRLRSPSHVVSKITGNKNAVRFHGNEYPKIKIKEIGRRHCRVNEWKQRSIRSEDCGESLFGRFPRYDGKMPRNAIMSRCCKRRRGEARNITSNTERKQNTPLFCE
jgi:hypothetical protein